MPPSHPITAWHLAREQTVVISPSARTFHCPRKPWQVPGKRSGIRSSTDNEYQTSGKPLLDLGQICGRKNVRPAAPARRLLGISHFLALQSWSRVLTSSSDWLVMVSFVPISPCNYFASFFMTEGSDKFYLSSLKSLVEICLCLLSLPKYRVTESIFSVFFGTKSAVLKLTLQKLLKGNGR